jgi:hypothetical protein
MRVPPEGKKSDQKTLYGAAEPHLATRARIVAKSRSVHVAKAEVIAGFLEVA